MGTPLEVSSLNFAYGMQQVLNGVSFEVSSLELVAIVGPNGAGKSTLLKLASGLLLPDSGEVRLFGKRISEYDAIERARKVSMVATGMPEYRYMSVFEFVLLGRSPYVGFLGRFSKQDLQIAQNAISMFDIGHIANSRIGAISSGEFQRCALAQAVAQQTPLLLLDEPTAHLDLYNQLHVMKRITSWARSHDVAILAVMHNLFAAAAFFDRILLLKEGTMVAQGSPHEVLTEENLVETFGVAASIAVLDGSLEFVLRYD